jgi:hypothetical protein
VTELLTSGPVRCAAGGHRNKARAVSKCPLQLVNAYDRRSMPDRPKRGCRPSSTTSRWTTRSGSSWSRNWPDASLVNRPQPRAPATILDYRGTDDRLEAAAPSPTAAASATAMNPEYVGQAGLEVLRRSGATLGQFHWSLVVKVGRNGYDGGSGLVAWPIPNQQQDRDRSGGIDP